MDRLIARSDQLLERQRRIIEMRRAAGLDVTAEISLLESLERSQGALNQANALLRRIKSKTPEVEPVERLTMLKLDWVKSQSGEWFDLESVASSSEARGWGVYVIWTPRGESELPGVVLRVGSGNILIRLYLEHLAPEFRLLGNAPILVTWAVVNPSHQLGVVRYLADQLSPYFHGAQMPDLAVPVNLPLIA